MSDFQKCRTCGEWGWLTGSFALPAHKCAPIWEVRMHRTRWEEDWTETHADDAEGAAAKFAEDYDRNGEYGIVSSGSAEVEVRKPGEDAMTIYDISAESVPQYTAHARTPQESDQ